MNFKKCRHEKGTAHQPKYTTAKKQLVAKMVFGGAFPVGRKARHCACVFEISLGYLDEINKKECLVLPAE